MSIKNKLKGLTAIALVSGSLLMPMKKEAKADMGYVNIGDCLKATYTWSDTGFNLLSEYLCQNDPGENFIYNIKNLNLPYVDLNTINYSLDNWSLTNYSENLDGTSNLDNSNYTGEWFGPTSPLSIIMNYKDGSPTDLGSRALTGDSEVRYTNLLDGTQTGFIKTPETPVVPEPISTTLFLIGSGVLGLRHLRNKAKEREEERKNY